MLSFVITGHFTSLVRPKDSMCPQVRSDDEIRTEEEFKTHEAALHAVIKMLTDAKTGVVSDPGEI
eukprot:scaffold462864_cov45-Prasinocladus_malaysianus.AAC.1